MDYGIHRYSFHGTSDMLHNVALDDEWPLSIFRIITYHLGNGLLSLCGGRSIDTAMSYSIVWFDHGPHAGDISQYH